jgi:hypothetical protein
MTYGRILLIAALAFGAIAYYQSEQKQRAKETHHHQLILQEVAANQREAERYRAEQAQEVARMQAEQRRAAEEYPRELARAYIDCFGRPPPRDPAFMSDKERLALELRMHPELLAANAGIPSPCRK